MCLATLEILIHYLVDLFLTLTVCAHFCIQAGNGVQILFVCLFFFPLQNYDDLIFHEIVLVLMK